MTKTELTQSTINIVDILNYKPTNKILITFLCQGGRSLKSYGDKSKNVRNNLSTNTNDSLQFFERAVVIPKKMVLNYQL